MAKHSYPIPQYALPSISYEAHLDDLREFIHLLESLGINVNGTRIARYYNFYEALIHGNCDVERIFQGVAYKEFNNQQDLELYVLREVHEIMWILKGLKRYLPKGIEIKLKEVVGGSDFAALDKDTTSRNTQFELRIASYFCQTGYKVDMANSTDIVATLDGISYFVECKRVTSHSALIKRLKEAKKQLHTKISRFTLLRRNYGVIAVDVTKVAFKHNGLTLGVTADHTRDIIQDQLNRIADDVAKSGFNIQSNLFLLTWLQIHIPALVINPNQCITRFSSLFSVNDRLRCRSLKAFRKLQQVLHVGDVHDKREIHPERLTLRKSVTLPTGTILRWDEELLRNILDNWILSKHQPKHIVLVMEIEGQTTEFSFFEFSILFVNLSEEDRLRYSNNHNLARAELAARLIMLRSPYED